MPTKIPFALKADGSVIAPTNWAMTIGDGSPHVKVSGFHIDGFPTGVTISGETDPCATWSNRGNDTSKGDGRFVLTGEGGGKVSTTGGTEDDPLCWTYDPIMHGKKGITWNLIGVDGNRGLLDGAANGETGVGTVSITVKAVKPQTFAIISDNGQMNFYHRVRVPSVGEEYDGLKIKHIYAGLDNLTVEKTTGDWFGETDAPWYGERNEPTSVKVIDDGVTVGRLSYLFQNCENIKTIDLYKMGRPTSSDITLFHMFSGCTSLSDLRIPEWRFEGCSSLDCTFFKCSSIETIDLSGIYGTVTNTCGAFDGCTHLREIKGIEHITSDGLYRIESCFHNCSSLEKLDLSGWTTKRVIAYDGGKHPETGCTRYDTFSGCSKLRVITLGDGFAFGNEIHNTDCYLPVPSPDSIDGADGKWYAASDGKGYAPRDMPTGKADTYYAVAPMSFAVYSSSDGSLNYYHRAGRPVKGDELGGKKVDGVYSGFEDKSYTHDSTPVTDGMNNKCNTPWYSIKDSIASISVVDSGIKPISLSHWFANMLHVKTIDISKLEVPKPVNCQWLFINCREMLAVSLPKNLTPSHFGDGFYWCASLKSDKISMPGFDTSRCWNMWSAFFCCKSLTYIPGIENWNTSFTSEFRDMFYDCPKLVADLSLWDVSQSQSGLDIPHNYALFSEKSPGIILPKAWQLTAFAIFDADDSSFNFYKREFGKIPDVGGTFENQIVSSVYTGFEEDEYTGTWPNDDCPWFPIATEVKKVAVIDTIKPNSLAWWFNQFTACESFDLGNIDTSECVSLKRLFSSDRACTSLLGLDKWDTGKVQNLDACFDGMVGLNEIPGIAGWNTSSCKTFNSAFFNCTELRKLDISGWSNESVVPEGTYGDEYVPFGYSPGGGYHNLEYVKIGAKWGHVGALLRNTSALMHIPGSDGNWYALSDGIGYSSSNIPDNKADTYYTTKALLEQSKRQ